ncbi:MAG: type IV secretion system protein VirB10 [Steroidobacteraceae bacterium]
MGRLWRRGSPRGTSAAVPGSPPQPDPREPAEAGAVLGERGDTLARRMRSVHARLNGWLAAALVVGVAVTMLSWYYTRALRGARPASPANGVRSQAMPSGPRPLGPLPPLERSALPKSAARSARPAALSRAAREAALVARFAPRGPRRPALGAVRGAPTTVRHRSKALQALLSGPVFTASAAPGAAGPQRGGAPAARVYPSAAPAQFRGAGSRLQALLRPTVMRATRAQLLPQRRLLLAKGTFIDCTLETAIDSTLPGMTTCLTARNTFSADGTVVLLERGTELIGETRGQVRQGQARVFVIWTEARTPTGVVVRLDSPSTDALGRSGLTGTVDTHFWARFGAALLISTVTGVVQTQAERAGGTLIIDPTESEGVVTGVLRGTEDIAPTINVPSGQRIEVLVARDVDFRPVYELIEH